MNLPTAIIRATASMAALLGGVLPSAFTAQVTIDFEGLVSNQGQPIDAYYSSYGVTFGNAVWFTPALIGTSYPTHWVRGQVGLGAQRGCSPVYPWITPGLTNPIVLYFAFPVTNILIDVFDVGSNGARLRGFDTAGAQVGNEKTVLGSGIGSGNGPYTLNLSGKDIRMVVLDQYRFTSVNDGVSFDNLRFVTLGPQLRLRQEGLLAQILLEGIVGCGYRIEKAGFLPAISWTPVTNFVLKSLPFVLVDPSSTNFKVQFYRAVELP
jgi:hypothetical protein